ncbi:PTS transporter subunit EIIC [Mesoplasma florum]|uniref:PTS transporter subunit EIIC n=1 Tax=Mesoplasma florum TaxID=2151 RepID=UPI000D0461D0|nr:PTS transporter subunit EIIC [Mesoplasma florum]AVN58930.1 hypothetical protein CG009_01655 [Mesoplasma florum]
MMNKEIYQEKKKKILFQIKSLEKENKKSFLKEKIEENKILQKFKNSDNYKKEKFESQNRLKDFKLRLSKKESLLKIELKNLKSEYRYKINKNWKEENKNKHESKIADLNSKIQKINLLYDEKINSILNKNENFKKKQKQIFNQNIEKINNLENEFIENYKNETKYYSSLKLNLENYKNVTKIKAKNRLIKKQLRNKEDLINKKISSIRDKLSIKVAKLNEKIEDIKQSNKPLTKNYFTKDLTNKMNRGISKLDQQRHMYSIKMGLIYLMPLTLVAAFWILFNNVILSTSQGGLLYYLGVQDSEGLQNFKSIGASVQQATLGIMGLALAFTISATLGDRYHLGKIESGVLGVTCFMLFVPLFTVSINDAGMTVINFEELGSGSMFLAIITGLLSIELYKFCLDREWLKIKMPKQIPTAVAKSFNVVIPFFLVSFFFASFSFSLIYFSGYNLKEIITIAVSKPLDSGIESLSGVIIIRLICDGLWVMGIHGQNMIGPIVSPTYVQHLTENAQLVAQGLEPKWIVTSTFMDSYTLQSCNIIPVIAVLLFSKRKDFVTIATISLIPAIFNISEPMLFGLPIILNPILSIPLILSSLLQGIFGYLAISGGFGIPLYIITPWTTPGIIGPWLASGGDFNNLLLALMLFGLGVVIYCPFILISNIQASNYNPEVIIARFTKITRKVNLRDKEAEEYLNELSEKNNFNVVKNKDVK